MLIIIANVNRNSDRNDRNELKSNMECKDMDIKGRK